jgi:excinuclease UvrABC helicase subunit UvrB
VHLAVRAVAEVPHQALAEPEQQIKVLPVDCRGITALRIRFQLAVVVEQERSEAMEHFHPM